MATFKKDYIGKGMKIGDFDIVQVYLSMEEVEKHVYEYNGKKYLGFELAKLQSPDKFGRTHTAYVSVMEKNKVEEPKPKTRRRKKKTS